MSRRVYNEHYVFKRSDDVGMSGKRDEKNMNHIKLLQNINTKYIHIYYGEINNNNNNIERATGYNDQLVRPCDRRRRSRFATRRTRCVRIIALLPT